MKIDGKFELSISGADKGKAADADEWAQPIWCVALGEKDGKLIPGTRLTQDMSHRDCRDALHLLKAHHQNAGMYLGAAVDGRSTPPYREHPNHFELKFFQVVHDALVGSKRYLNVPLGQRWDTHEGAAAELPKFQKLNNEAYISEYTTFFNRMRPEDLVEFNAMKATVRSAA